MNFKGQYHAIADQYRLKTYDIITKIRRFLNQGIS